ncbi:MAG: hypothetical protein WCT16_04150 [Candidatus Buchananbacteria bacterium]
MNIAFDGNVFTGKTTLIKKITQTGRYAVVPEYPCYISKVKNIPACPVEFREHYSYLLADSLRQKDLSSEINLLDRSFVSLAAHIYALYKIGRVDWRKNHLAAFSELLEQKSIIIPDFFVFVFADYKTAKERFSADQCLSENKGTSPLFIEPDYFSAVDEFNRLWQRGIDCGLTVKCDGGSMESIVVANIKGGKFKKIAKKRVLELMESIFFMN